MKVIVKYPATNYQALLFGADWGKGHNGGKEQNALARNRNNGV